MNSQFVLTANDNETVIWNYGKTEKVMNLGFGFVDICLVPRGDLFIFMGENGEGNVYEFVKLGLIEEVREDEEKMEN